MMCDEIEIIGFGFGPFLKPILKAYVQPEMKTMPYVKAMQCMNFFDQWYEKGNGLKPAKFGEDPYLEPLYKAPGIEKLWICWRTGFLERNKMG